MTKKGYQKRLPTVLPSPTVTPPRADAPEARPPAVPLPRVSSEPHTRPPPERQPAQQLTPRGASAVAPKGPVSGRARVLLVVVGFALVTIIGAAVVRTTMTAEPEDSPAASSVPRGWPPAGATRTVADVRPDGVLAVTHWIHTRGPLDALQIALPDHSGKLVASQVEVVADGRPASGQDQITLFRASYLVDSATRILVRYRLTGAVELGTSAPGRGLVTTTALEVSAGDLREHRVVRSEAVLSLACAQPGAQPEPCGEAEGDDQWSVRLTDEQAGARVLAVVTVPQ